MMKIPDTTGVYLLHYHTPLHHAQHYLGKAQNLLGRIDAHMIGKSRARLPEVMRDLNNPFTIGRIWETDTEKEAYELEHTLKRQKNSPRYCTICTSMKGA